MEPHQERMQTEFKELNDRVIKLMNFFYNEDYKKFNLSEDEIVDMRCTTASSTMCLSRNASARHC